jgi:hypothetical protein
MRFCGPATAVVANSILLLQPAVEEDKEEDKGTGRQGEVPRVFQ